MFTPYCRSPNNVLELPHPISLDLDTLELYFILLRSPQAHPQRPQLSGGVRGPSPDTLWHP
eukprot:scaffold21401_cov27-Tisochrysis_lutea.AAC.4